MKEISNLFLNFVSFSQTLNWKDVYIVGIAYGALLWLAFLLAAHRDSKRRFKHTVSSIVLFIFLFPFNIPGLIIYLLLRPGIKEENEYWVELEKKYLQFETDGIDICKCGQLLKPSYMVCPNCNNILRNNCEQCKKIIELKWKVCPYCLNQTGYQEEVILVESRFSKLKKKINMINNGFKGIISKNIINKHLKNFFNEIGMFIKSNTKSIIKLVNILLDYTSKNVNAVFNRLKANFHNTILKEDNEIIEESNISVIEKNAGTSILTEKAIYKKSPKKKSKMNKKRKKR